tara:strand:+ start:73 stop:363 length:291 start_codon:yes stop_codon:yes gene_type:complete
MDNRKNNGNKGHSTKAKEGTIDKRKNEYRKALEEASDKQDVIDVINMIKIKAIKDKDIQAGKLFLEYYIGKPKDSVDITTNGEMINIPIIKFVKSE